MEVWELLCGHDLSNAEFWMRRGFTEGEVARAREADCPFPGIDPDDILAQCGWPGSDTDPGPRHACLEAWVRGGALPRGGGGPGGGPAAAGGGAAAYPGLPSSLWAPSPLGGIPWIWLGAGALALVLLIVLLRR